jgi:hypothetical protein
MRSVDVSFSTVNYQVKKRQRHHLEHLRFLENKIKQFITCASKHLSFVGDGGGDTKRRGRTPRPESVRTSLIIVALALRPLPYERAGSPEEPPNRAPSRRFLRQRFIEAFLDSPDRIKITNRNDARNAD